MKIKPNELIQIRRTGCIAGCGTEIIHYSSFIKQITLLFVYNIDNCHRCGQCPVGYLLKMRDDYGFCLAIATGGTVARRIVVQTHPHCIIAVACERDLTSGIQDSYPVPVFGVLNKRPCGPCIDTIVSLSALENIVCLFLNRKSLAEITSHGLA